MDKLVQWSETWQLTFATHKCNVLQIGNSKTVPACGINGIDLLPINPVTDVGIELDRWLLVAPIITLLWIKLSSVLS